MNNQAQAETSAASTDVPPTGRTKEPLVTNNTPMSNHPLEQQPMEVLVDDSRATSLTIKNRRGEFICGPSLERFSGHTGACRVLGNKKLPIVPHALQLGDFIRIGSVGLVVCEINRECLSGSTARDSGLNTTTPTSECLTEDQLRVLKQTFLSYPLLDEQRCPPQGPRTSWNPVHNTMTTIDDVDDDRSNNTNNTTTSGDECVAVKPQQQQDEDPEEDEELEEEDAPNNTSDEEEDARVNHHCTMSKLCYICYDDEQDLNVNPLVAPCECKGDTKYVHLNCLLRWNNNHDDQDPTKSRAKVCAVTNTDGLDVCSICKATYCTQVTLEDGRQVSLVGKKLDPPYVTFAVVTQHETRTRATALTNSQFQLSFASIVNSNSNTSNPNSSSPRPDYLTIGRSTSNHMVLRYRTVSQMHAQVKFDQNQFYLSDAGSSNGTMLFLRRPLELHWGKLYHIKMGRTILALKARKKWKWVAPSSSSSSSSSLLGVQDNSTRLSLQDSAEEAQEHHHHHQVEDALTRVREEEEEEEANGPEFTCEHCQYRRCERHHDDDAQEQLPMRRNSWSVSTDRHVYAGVPVVPMDWTRDDNLSPNDERENNLEDEHQEGSQDLLLLSNLMERMPSIDTSVSGTTTSSVNTWINED